MGLRAAAAGLYVVGLLSGCGGDDEPSAEDRAASAFTDARLVIGSFPDDVQEKMCTAFEADRTVTIDATFDYIVSRFDNYVADRVAIEHALAEQCFDS